MKKMIRFGLCLGLLSAALTCTALAAGTATEGYTTANDGCTVTHQGGKYTASYAGAQNGNQYALLVVKGTPGDYSVSEDTIVYIDQQEATGAGVSFENWIPMSTPDCVVLLGGTFADGKSPKVLGTLKGQGVTVSGSVTLQGRTNYAGATVTLSGGTTATATTDSTGAYTLNSIPAGTYTLKITMPGYLSYTKNALTVENTMTVETKALLGGDVASGFDGYVNASDLRVITDNFSKEPPYEGADINNDGYMNAKEISIILSNFGKSAVTE